MKDLTIALDDRPGALADLGTALGRAGVSIEGGGGAKRRVRFFPYFFVQPRGSDRRIFALDSVLRYGV